MITNEIRFDTPAKIIYSGMQKVVLLLLVSCCVSCSNAEKEKQAADLLIRAESLEKQGQYSDASKLLLEALNLTPRNEQVLFRLAGLYAQLDLTNQAIETYRRLLSLNDDHPQAHNNLGHLLGRQGKLDEAIVHFEKAVELAPQLAGPTYNLGQALFLKGNFRQAEDLMTRATMLNPNEPKYQESLGLLYKTTGRIGKAISVFSSLTRIDSTTAIYHYHLAMALSENRQYDEALKSLERYISLTDDREERTIARNKIFEIRRLRTKARATKTMLP